MGVFNEVDQELIKVANGQIDGFGHQVRHVFGYNPDVDSAAEETVWTAGDLGCPEDISYSSAVVTFSSGMTSFEFDYPITLPAGSCITATVKSTTDNEIVSSYFQVLLVKQ